MKIFDVAITCVLIGVGAGMATLPTEPTQCGPDEVCYPIDPQKPPQPPLLTASSTKRVGWYVIR
jgi:hypothetical protein